jgi:hypothetical protein
VRPEAVEALREMELMDWGASPPVRHPVRGIPEGTMPEEEEV